MRLAFIAAALYIVIATFASAQELEWSKRYEDTSGSGAPTIARGIDGGFMVLGRSSRDVKPPPRDASYALRLLADGRFVWDTLGILAPGVSERWVLPRGSGGYFILGMPVNGGLHVVQISATNKVISSLTYGDSRDRFFAGTARPTADGGFIICGTLRIKPTDLYTLINVMQFDRDGNFVWQRTVSLPELSETRSVRQLADGGFAIVSSGLLNNRRCVVVTKIDVRGDSVWSKRIEHTLPLGGVDIVERNDGGFVVGAYAMDTSKRMALHWLSADGTTVERDSVYSGLGSMMQLEMGIGRGYLILTWNNRSELHHISDVGSLVWTHIPTHFEGAIVNRILPFDQYIAMVGARDVTGIRVALLRAPVSSVARERERVRILDLW